MLQYNISKIYKKTKAVAQEKTGLRLKEVLQMFKWRKKREENTKAEEEKIVETKAEEEVAPEEIVVEGVETEGENTEKRTIKAVYRVIYDSENKEWMVKKDGAQRVIRRVRTKAEALELANQFATNQELAMSVQKKDGKFQKKRNYKAMMSSDKTDK